MKEKLTPLNVSIKISSNKEFQLAVKFFQELEYKLGFTYNSNTGNELYESFVFLNKGYDNCIDLARDKYYRENIEVTISEFLKLKVFKYKIPKWKKYWKGQS